MTERTFQTKFTKWAKHNWHTNAAFELKLVKGASFPFSAIREHQWLCLKNAKHRNLVHKIADGGFSQTPFDCFVLSGSQAYFAIMFYTPRKSEFFLIDVDVMERLKIDTEAKGFKSCSEDTIRIHADHVCILK